MLNFKTKILNKQSLLKFPFKTFIRGTERQPSSGVIKRPLNIAEGKIKKFQKLAQSAESAFQLKALLKNQIDLGGAIPLDEYINTCLYHPDLGYYTSKEHVFGEKGDYITAPELSHVFGEMITLFIYKILESLHFPKQYDLLEIGPGRGFLMADVINALYDLKVLKGINFILIEKSPKLIKIQQEQIYNKFLKLKIFPEFVNQKDKGTEGFVDKKHKITVTWYKDMEQLITHRTGTILHKSKDQNLFKHFPKYVQAKVNPRLNPLIVVNNEFFDALAIKKFIYKGGGWREVLIANNAEKTNLEQKEINFKYDVSEINSQNVLKYLEPEKTFIEQGIVPKENDSYEFSLEQIGYMYALNYLLATTEHGHMLVCDYGAQHAFSNSLRGLRNHTLLKDEAILKNTGECDITSYVNFKALKRTLNSFSELNYGGLMPQNAFLTLNMIHQRFEVLMSKASSENEKKSLELQTKKLLDEEEMGHNYKFLYVHSKRDNPVFPFIQEVFDELKKSGMI